MAKQFERTLKIEVQGAEEVAAGLRQFKAGRARKFMRSGMTKALRKLLKRVKAAAPHDTYALHKSLISDTKTDKKDRIIVGVVGVAKRGQYTYTTADGKRKLPNLYGYVIERGSAERRTQKGARRGRVAATNFMEKERDRFADEFYSIYETAVRDALRREFAKQ